MSDALATFRLAQDALLAGRPDHALELLGSIPADDSIALFQGAIGVAHHLLGNLDQAIASFQGAIAAERGQLAGLHYNLGAALAAAGQLDDAASSYIDALAMQPALQVALVNLAVVRQSQGRVAEAESCLRTALDREPGDLNARYNLGAVLCGVGRYAEAEVELRAAGDVPGALSGLAAAIAAQGRHAEAIDVFRAAVAQEPGRVDAQRGLAAALVTEGQAAEGLTVAEHACALAPDDDDAEDLRGTCLAALGRFDEAVVAYRRAVSRSPGRVSTLGNLGTVLERAGAHDEAIQAFTDALALDPDHRASRIGRAGAYASAQRRDDALAAYQDLLVREPDNPGWAHMVAALGGDNPAAPPEGYIARVFDSYADKFEVHLVGDLAYRAPALVRDALAGRRFGRALDLGCGTGLLGAELRGQVEVLHGVDLSPKMVAQADAKHVYDTLWIGELVQHLDAVTAPYDLVTAADVLCYLGDLAPVFAAAARAMTGAGVLAFTVEQGDDDYRLRANGRYAHAGAYLDRLAAAHGFTVTRRDAVALRLEHGAPVEGWLCVMERA